MKVLLTGASGFLGAHTARALLESGHEVAALVRPGVPAPRLAALADRLARVEGDLDNPASFDADLAAWSPEACVHLAWYAEPGQYLHSPRSLSALTGSLALLERLKRLGCRYFLGAGTCAEYEAAPGWLHEDGPTRPETLYAAAKLSLCLLGPHLASPEMRFGWARIFYPYGPWEDPRRAVPALIGSLRRGEPFEASAGSQVRDYLHAEDIAAAFCRLVDTQAEGIYNVASGEPVTMRRLMETLGEITGRGDLIRFGALPPRDWDPPFICGDTRRLRGLGWTPRRSLTNGLRDTVDWWRQTEEEEA